MAQRITKHSTRLSQVHEGTRDAEFSPGDRVQTIDGLPGRVLFVSASYAPGVTEYEVALDSGMGQGVYTASQLRPIPDSYRGGTSPVPHGLLPSGVTGQYLTTQEARDAWLSSPEAMAGMSAEDVLRSQAAEAHTADLDYPEMGTVLTDRPDPGQLTRVIGGLRKTAADTYGGQEDPRDEDYNGGPNDTGVDWAEPGQQQWMHENEPQEEAPPPSWEAAMESPVLARLAQIEEARRFFGTPRQETAPARRHATTINGTQIDDHGDAPEHGTVPRAAAPDSYDDRSTEGDGDPKWSGQDDPHQREHNGAAVAMYPEGISAGGGPGLEIGAFTAHMYPEGTHETERHLIEQHGVTPAELSSMRLRAWHTYGPELQMAHSRVSRGAPLDDWRGDTRLTHSRIMNADELEDHLVSQHGLTFYPGTAPGEMARRHYDDHDRRVFNSGERHGPPRDPGYGEPEAPDEYGADEGTAATYQAHTGPIDPVFGSRHVPWTGHERDELHGWEAAPTAGWGDFVNRDHFTNHTPAEKSTPGSVEEMQAEAALAANWSTPGGSEMSEDETASYQPFDAAHWADSPSGHPEYSRRPVEMAPMDEHYSRWAEDADPAQHASGEHGRFEHTLSRMMREAGLDPDEAAAWAEHLTNGHGWGPENIERSRARGQDFADMHAELHRMGLADHEHRSDAELEREQHLTSVFGPEGTSNPPMYNPLRWGYDRAPRGGHAESDPMERLITSRPLPKQPSYEDRFGPAKFRQMMSALDPPHPHDDDTSSLDSGPSEGDEGFPETHDDLDAPIPPQAWPMAGAGTTEGGPAFTQGREDGNRGRKFPPPPPPPMPSGMGDEDGSPGSGDPNDPDGRGKKIQLEIKAHLDAFVAASRNPEFRFEFTAAWTDVIAKARRIRKEGRVRITHASAGMVIGAVSGDHDVYETGIQRPPGKPQSIQHWACGCPWASFHQDKALGTRYAGRPCSHVMALQFEAQARTMFGREMHEDPGIANHEVVVKSMPPWTPSGWAQTWLAPSASLRKTAEMWCPACQGDRDEYGRCMDCGLVSRDLRQEKHLPGAVNVPERALASLHQATPDEARDADLSPEEREERWPQLVSSRQNTPVGLRCHYKHGGPCEMRGPDRIAESLRHSRPRTFYSEITENPDFEPGERYDSNRLATHVLNGYLGPQLAGQLHFTQSDDGKALRVENLHTSESSRGQGVASAMMDDLYHHAAGNRAWINHGIRTAGGNDWWASYREPFPEINVHHAHPHAGWMKYWSVPAAAEEARNNYETSGGRGAHTWPPAYDPYEFSSSRRRDRWTHALGLTPGQRATAALAAAGEDLGDIIALAQLAGVTAELCPSDAMIWRHLDTAHAGGHESARSTDVSPYRYHDVLHEQRAAMKIPHSHDAPSAPEPGSWRLSEASLTVEADQANAPWGSSNVSQHPPGKPYGATQPPDKDKDPGSYGPLSGPDPENWGGIQEDNIFQAPLSNEASVRPVPGDVHWPDMNGWEAAGQDDQESYPYSDRANTAGPSTSISPRDPGGIRMEESQRQAAGTPFPYHGEIPQLDGALAELKDEPEPALPSTTGDDIEATALLRTGCHVCQDGSDSMDAARGTCHNCGRPVARTAAADGGGTAMGDQAAAEGLTDQAQEPSVISQEPGMGSADEPLSPEDQSIQTVGHQQWSGGGADSDEVTVPVGDAQGSLDDIVAAFQRSAAAKQLADGGGLGAGGAVSDGDIADAARQFLSKTADVLPDKEAAELIAEGRGQRARNLGLLRLEGTHYEEEAEDLARRGVSLDDYDDDVISV